MSSRAGHHGHRKPVSWVRPTVAACMAALLGLGGLFVLQRELDGAGALPSASQAGGGTVTAPTSAAAETTPSPKPTNRGKAKPSRTIRARDLMRRQGDAVENGNRSAFVGAIDPRQGDVRQEAERIYRNLDELDVSHYRVGDVVVDEGGLTPRRRDVFGKQAWVAEVEVSFRIEHAGDVPWTTTLRPVFVERDGKLYLGALNEGQSSGTPQPLWAQDEVSAVSGDHSLIIGTGSTERLEDYRRIVDDAVERISEIWTRPWDRRVVVLVPRTMAQMERVVGAETGSQSQVAAVTTSVGRSNVEQASQIVVNPTTFDSSGPLSRQVLLTHESVHVATQATMSNVPVWLSEGFADYIGYLDSGVPSQTIARTFLEEIRDGTASRQLPTSRDFDPSAADLDLAYERAWLACRYIAQTWGEDELVGFYAAMNDAITPQMEARAYQDVLSVTPQRFAEGWWEYAQDQAS